MRRLVMLPVLAILAVTAPPASAAGFSGDFNADGFDDLAVGVPGEALGDRTAAGEVQVFYGRPDRDCGGGDPPSLRGTNSQTITQDTSGVPGIARERDRFGAAVATGDVDGDGYDDLAVGAPGDAGGAGTATIFRGSVDGLVPDRADLVRQGVAGVPGAEEDGDEFGGALLVTRVSQGVVDVVVGAPGEGVGSAAGAGAVTVVRRPLGSGGTALSTQQVTQDTPGVPGRVETGDGFGGALSPTGLGFAGFAVGVPGEAIGATLGAGVVDVLPTGDDGTVASSGARELRQGAGGVPGVPEAADRFGAALWGHRGLHVGVPGEGVGAVARAGLVAVVPEGGGAPQAITQSTPQVPGVPERDDAFGTALGTNIEGAGEVLWVGAPGDSALLALNRADGLSGAGEPGAQVVAQAGPETELGSALTVGDFNCAVLDSESEVAVGGPGGSGRVLVLYHEGTADPAPQRVETLTQGTTGVSGTPEIGDRFGAGL
jgi:FG-GAP repeat